MGWCMWDPDENRNLYRIKRRHDDLS
jgi:hypothetical protein